MNMNKSKSIPMIPMKTQQYNNFYASKPSEKQLFVPAKAEEK